jgi:lantibiotic biosynthesis protein
VSRAPRPRDPPAPSWRPLLEGDDAAAAAVAVAELAHLLWHEAEAVAADPSRSSTGTIRPVEHPSLDGLAGVSLLLLYLDRALQARCGEPLPGLAAAVGTLDPNESWGERGRALLDRAIRGSAAVANFPPALFDGFVGVAWLIEHLANLDLEEMEKEERAGIARQGPAPAGSESAVEASDAGEPIAAVLRQYLGQTPWVRHFDLVSGLVGCGAWALERLPRPGGEECLRQVVARLAETAHRQESGVAWLTPARLLPPHQRDTCPDGHYNLGVAHGVPGAIGVLAGAWEMGVERTRVLELLAGAVRWLSAHQLPPGSGSVYPYYVATGREAKVPGVAWCYGDLGIAVSLLAAARRVGVAAWEQAAITLARQAAARRPAPSARQDACLCHGAAGNGHLCNRLYQATGEPRFGAAARWWLGRALTLRRPGTGLAGFSYWAADERGEPALFPVPGFLDGAVGTALALLAAITSVPPEWDRLLLVSVPAG